MATSSNQSQHHNAATARQGVVQQPQQNWNQSNTSTATTTTTSSTFGGQARQAAAAKGEQELRRFDQTVQQMLVNASSAECPSAAKYYPVKDGYLCGIGNHFISNRDVDMMMKRGIPPLIEPVNSILDELRYVAPPADGWHEPFHWDPVSRDYNGLVIMPIKYDGSEWDLGPLKGSIELEKMLVRRYGRGILQKADAC